MKKSSLLALLCLIFSPQIMANEKYDFGATRCPKADEINHYINVPVFHDLKHMAKIDNIPNLNLHDDIKVLYEDMEISLFYETVKKFDPNKETVFLIPGGPGQSHGFIHSFQESMKGKSTLFEKYNIVVMDHRGLGCSRPLFPRHDEPSEALTMRYAAADIEAIRKELSPDKKIHIWGFSYGSMLAQTYALLFPESIEHLFLGGAFSAAEDFTRAQKEYEKLVSTSSIGIKKYQSFSSKYPEYKKRFLSTTVNDMYTYEGRTKYIPERLDTIVDLLSKDDIQGVNDILDNKIPFVMPWMMRSISCIEIFKPANLGEDRFTLFNDLFNVCFEFEGKHEHFNYTESLINLPMETMIFGGEFDHVTPAFAMRNIATKIPNNFLYIDQHIGHDFTLKEPCFAAFMDEFFANGISTKLNEIEASASCQNEPVIPENSEEE